LPLDSLFYESTLHLFENMFGRKRLFANLNPNPKAQFQLTPTLILNPKEKTDEMTSFFKQVYRYRFYCALMFRSCMIWPIVVLQWSMTSFRCRQQKDVTKMLHFQHHLVKSPPLNLTPTFIVFP